MTDRNRQALQQRGRDAIQQEKAAAREARFGGAALPLGPSLVPRINQILQPIAELNQAVNHISTFAFESVKFVDNPQRSMEIHLQPNVNYVVTLSAIDDWRAVLTAELPLWLFPQWRQADRALRKDMVSVILDLLDRAIDGKTATAWEVDITAGSKGGLKPWYAAAWRDYLFESEAGLFLLHLDISD
jgi:hypothetical protein